VELKERMSLYICPKTGIAENLLKNYISKLQRLIGIEKIYFTDEILQLPSIQTPLRIVYLQVAKVNSVEDKKKSTWEFERLSKLIRLNEIQLSCGEFLTRASAHIIQGTKKGQRV
jgi:hypothetical protein